MISPFISVFVGSCFLFSISSSSKLYFPNLGMITLSVIIVPIYATNNVLIIIKIRFPFV